MDIRNLSNHELKEQLLQYGIMAGPILPTTRRVYEKKLRQLLEDKVHDNRDAHNDNQYLNIDDEGVHLKCPMEFMNDVINGRGGGGGAINGINSYCPTNISACIAAEFNQTLATLGDDFSVTKMLKQIGQKSSFGQTSGTRKKDGKNVSFKSQPESEYSTFDDFSEVLSQSALGMSATRRKPIKGAAGRPIQFQYDDIIRRAKMKEQTRETVEEKSFLRLFSVPTQIAIFILVVFFALVFLTMESSTDNPFQPLTKEDANLQQP